MKHRKLPARRSDEGARLRHAHPRAPRPLAPGACLDCQRRSWLLEELGPVLDYRGRDLSRLLATLELEDLQLIEALGGRRRTALRESWERFAPTSQPTPSVASECSCRHQSDWPAQLVGWDGAPRLLHVAPGAERLRRALPVPTVAIAGTSAATDYGMELAANLARELTLSGVTIVSGFAEGIGASALAGALAGGAPASGVSAPARQKTQPLTPIAIAVMAGGIDVCAPAGRRELYRALQARNCVVAELPAGARARRWCAAAQARTVAWLADLTIVVEADDNPRELLVANVAQMLGRRLAAIPGRVTSPQSRGTNALIMAGAQLISDAADAIELLEPRPASDRRAGSDRVDAGDAPSRDTSTCIPSARERPPLERRLRLVLERVGGGYDTLAQLTARGGDAAETMLALAELELMGLLARGEGGRYVPSGALERSAGGYSCRDTRM